MGLPAHGPDPDPLTQPAIGPVARIGLPRTLRGIVHLSASFTGPMLPPADSRLASCCSSRRCPWGTDTFRPANSPCRGSAALPDSPERRVPANVVSARGIPSMVDQGLGRFDFYERVRHRAAMIVPRYDRERVAHEPSRVDPARLPPRWRINLRATSIEYEAAISHKNAGSQPLQRNAPIILNLGD